MKETFHFHHFRKPVCVPVSGMTQPIYMMCTFKRAGALKVEVDGEKRTVMRPTNGTMHMLRKYMDPQDEHLYNIEQLYEGKGSIEAYTTFPFPAIHFLRETLEDNYGHSFNVGIDDIGAEFIYGSGILKPLHTLQLYRVIDDDYCVNYVLSASLATLEEKTCELHNTKSIPYEDTMFEQDYFEITDYKLLDFSLALAEDYFGIDSHNCRIKSHTNIFLLDPSTPDFAPVQGGFSIQPNDNTHNYRIGILFRTDENYTPG